LSRLLGLLDNILDVDEDLLETFSCGELLEAILIPLKVFLSDGKFESFTLIYRPIHLLNTLNVNGNFFSSLKIDTYDDIIVIVTSFSHRCLTWRVLSRDKENHTFGDSYMSCGEVATLSILQVASCVLSKNIHEKVNEGKSKKFKNTIELFAKQILDTKGILANIEINYEDDRPWSDISNEPFAQNINEVCRELMRSADSVLTHFREKPNI